MSLVFASCLTNQVIFTRDALTIWNLDMIPKRKISSTSKPELKKLDYISTHRDIVEECKRGNRQAQFELYRLYAKGMYNICLRMVGREGDAEDLLQNSFIDVFTKLHTFRYQSSIGAWIKRIVVNNCINFLKRKRIYFEDLSNAYEYELSTHDNEPGGGQVNVEAIKQALFQLPDGYRVVFSLYSLEGYDHKEIAQILNVTEATSKSQYSRAKKKLKELLHNRSLRSNC